MKHKPAFVFNICVPFGYFDINMSPDKREIVFSNEEVILNALRDEIDRIYAPSRYTFDLSLGMGADTFAANLGDIQKAQRQQKIDTSEYARRHSVNDERPVENESSAKTATGKSAIMQVQSDEIETIEEHFPNYPLVSLSSSYRNVKLDEFKTSSAHEQIIVGITENPHDAMVKETILIKRIRNWNFNAEESLKQFKKRYTHVSKESCDANRPKECESSRHYSYESAIDKDRQSDVADRTLARVIKMEVMRTYAFFVSQGCN